MSNDKNDKDDGYEPVVGFSVPIKRVLGHEERPKNPDGSRSGSLFMTIEGCSFKDGALQGSAAVTVGAPSVVINVLGENHDYLTSSRTSSRYIVSAHDIVQVAINAHKARMAKDKPSDDSGSSGLADPKTISALRRISRMVWTEVGKARNPFLSGTMYGGRNNRRIDEKFAAWNVTQVELGRALFNVVINDETPDLGLINRALDFLES